MGNGVGTEGERLEGEGDLAATPKPDKMPEKTADTAPTPVASQQIATPASSDGAPQKEQDPAAKAVPVKSDSGAPSVKVKEPEEQTTAAATQPWGELHSMNEELGNFYLASSRVVIGRHRDCTLRLQGPLISGKHCTITRQIYEGAEQIECYFLLDTSSNGTFLDGTVIGRGVQRRILPGAKISFPWRPEANSTEKLPDKLILFEFRLIRRQGGEEWKQVEQHYKIGKELGSGAFAVVRLATHKETNKKYAMKIVDKQKMSLVQTDRNVRDVLMTEVEVLKKLDHPNILKLFQVFDTKSTLFMVLELVNGGDLYDSLKAAGRLPEKVAKPIFAQLLAAIHYMHQKNVSHRDLKPENVLVQKDANGKIQVKLSDFGLSRATKTGQTLMQTMAGTLEYCAPEIIQHYHTGMGYGREVDMWSLGVILYIMLSGTSPFGQGNQAKQLLTNITEGNFCFPDRRFGDVSDTAKNLINMLLVIDPKTRWTAEQALKHDWLKGLGRV